MKTFKIFSLLFAALTITTLSFAQVKTETFAVSGNCGMCKANIEKAAIEFNGIDPFNPLRGAVSEKEALSAIFKGLRKGLKETDCHRAIVVAHNAAFDHGFMMAAAERAGLKRNPFHPFATFDTATLAGLALGQTVLAKACMAAGIAFDNKEAHSALYDTQRTAELFCYIVNRWKSLGGWPPAE